VAVPDQPIVLDLAELSFIDSSGIHCIVKICSVTGHAVQLRNTQSAVRRILDLVDPSRGHQAWIFDGEGEGDPAATSLSPSGVSP
jgi:STAS domain